jgi:hypothetical protein
LRKLFGCYELRVLEQQNSLTEGYTFFLWWKNETQSGLFCSVPLETENSEKESTPTSSKISKTPDLRKAELPFPFGKQVFWILGGEANGTWAFYSEERINPSL